MYGCGISTGNVLISALSECKRYHLSIPLIQNKGLCGDHSDLYGIISMSRYEGSNDHTRYGIEYKIQIAASDGCVTTNIHDLLYTRYGLTQ